MTCSRENGTRQRLGGFGDTGQTVFSAHGRVSRDATNRRHARHTSETRGTQEKVLTRPDLRSEDRTVVQVVVGGT